jgi:hypothetical protein
MLLPQPLPLLLLQQKHLLLPQHPLLLPLQHLLPMLVLLLQHLLSRQTPTQLLPPTC